MCVYRAGRFDLVAMPVRAEALRPGLYERMHENVGDAQPQPSLYHQEHQYDLPEGLVVEEPGQNDEAQLLEALQDVAAQHFLFLVLGVPPPVLESFVFLVCSRLEQIYDHRQDTLLHEIG